MAVASARVLRTRRRTSRTRPTLPGASLGVQLSTIAPSGQVVVGMRSYEQAVAQGLVECTRCNAWHTPTGMTECDRRAAIAWSELRERAHTFDPSA